MNEEKQSELRMLLDLLRTIGSHDVRNHFSESHKICKKILDRIDQLLETK